MPLVCVPPRGKCCSFLSFCVFEVWFGVFCRFLSFLLSKGRFLKNFRERTFVFGWLCWSCVFWWVFAYVFASFLAVRSRNCPEKFSCCQVWCFFAVVLFSFGFFRRRRFSRFFCLRDRDQVVTGHPFTRTCFVVPFFFFCVPPLLSVSPVLAVRPASRRFSRGAILGPARFWDSP